MLLSIIIFSLAALGLTLVNARNGRHLEGFRAGLRQLALTLPVIAPAFILAGMLEAIIPDTLIRDWLAAEAGFKGIFMGTFMGMFLAMGPYASFPVIASIYNAGAGLGTTISLITGWSLLGLSRFPFESGFLGLRFTLARMALGLPLCFAAGLAAYMLELLV